jgi:hypothetical protein
MNNNNYKLIKTVRVLPKDGVVFISLDGQSEWFDLEMAYLNEEHGRGYAFTIYSAYIRTIYEDDLNWGENGEAVIVNFYETKNYSDYDVTTKNIAEMKYYLSEFLFPYQSGMNILAATQPPPDDPDDTSSIKLGKFDIIQIAIFLDKKDEAEEINVIYRLINNTWSN